MDLDTNIANARPVGHLLREWRQRRRMSQLDLACEAEISTRHLSFLETGRSAPSRDMVLRLAERLDVPLRARNTLLNAAGYAPVFPERKLDDPAMTAARRAIDLVLAGHEPHPALAVDRHWFMAAANRAVAPLITGVDPALLEPPVNVLRLSLHPGGLAPRTVNLADWRANLLERLRQQIEVSGDPVLTDLMAELRSYPTDACVSHSTGMAFGAVFVPFRLATDEGVLSFFSTTTVFGTPIEVTLSELALECFFPADDMTIEAMRRLTEPDRTTPRDRSHR
jgi:transcriptional regulator with XRE-family HTH domain